MDMFLDSVKISSGAVVKKNESLFVNLAPEPPTKEGCLLFGEKISVYKFLHPDIN